MNYEFNGMIDSVLPNLYINKITLEQKNSQPLSNNKYDMSPHIDETVAPTVVTEEEVVTMFGIQDEIVALPAPSLTPEYGSFKDVLKVTFDLFLEIPNIDSDGFWQEIFSDEFSKYLSANIILFHGAKAKKYYKKILGQPSPVWAGANVTVQDVASYLDNSWIGETYAGGPPNWPLVLGTDYEYISVPSLFDQLLDPGLFLAPSEGTPPNDAQKLALIKQKYAKTLPDGTVVHKVPIRLSTEIAGAFPTSLAAIAYCAWADPAPDLWEAAGATALPIGRAATEVIIRNKKVEQKGMIFFVSAQQDSKAFKHLEGQLWFGGVHKHGGRYMAGNQHSEALHPYLDYIMVPNRRVQDFRQIGVIQKQIASFNPFLQGVFGGSYTDLRSSTTPDTFEKYGLFSDLLSTVTKDKRAKLFFSVDWGKAIKKYCAVPAVLDTLSNPSLSEWFSLKEVMNEASRIPISFKVFRERVDGPGESGVVSPKNNASMSINRLNRELIYDNYPLLYYWKDLGAPGLMASAPASSALVPVTLATAEGLHKHYSLTDYDVKNTSNGIFKYSVEIEAVDPTIAFLVVALETMQTAVATLKKYMYLANGLATKADSPQPEYYWNSYLGKFEEPFIQKAIDDVGFAVTNNGFAHPPSLANAFPFFAFFLEMSRIGGIAHMSAHGAEDTKEASGSALFALDSMLSPDTASPDSIAVVYQVFDTLTTQAADFLNSFSTANAPKVDSGQFCCDEDGTSFSGNPLLQSKSPVSSQALTRNITIAHTFGGPTELVDTKKFDAGYDILADTTNRSSPDVGFKIITYQQFASKVGVENDKYFKIPKPAGMLVTSLKIAPSFAGGFTISTRPWQTLTVGKNFLKGDKWVQFTRLPKSIKDQNEENDYWKLINNIIRYKLNLAGNPGEQSWLGYGAPNSGYQKESNIPGSEFIGNKMERILKEYQSLSSLNAYFAHQHKAFLGDAALGKDISNLPYTGATAEQEILQNDGTTVPWAKNVGQERFLLSLIIQDYCDLTYWDKKLKSFDATSGGPLTKYLKSFGLAGTAGIEQDFIAAAQGLPDQVKVLMAAFDGSNYELIQDSKNYGAAPTDASSGVHAVYVQGGHIGATEPESPTKTLLLNKFGDFWFNHQNLLQIEYLSGYKRVPVVDLPWVSTGPSLFETHYNASMKAPVWLPFEELPIGPPGLPYLCRLKKLRLPFFNQHLYNLLDMPLYDEYFFLIPEEMEATSGTEALWPVSPEQEIHAAYAIGDILEPTM